jgi:hypothetical protein
MPRVSNEINTQYWEPVAQGPIAQADLSTAGELALPATIAASGNYTSPVLPADGFKMIAAAVTSTQNGQISIQRYIDAAGQVAQGAPLSTAITGGTPAVVNAGADNLPFQSFMLKITNTGASTATLSNFALLLNAS